MSVVFLSQNCSSLLSYAVSQLKPEIFSHPVWVQFGKKKKTLSPDLIENLLNEARHLQDFDLDSACQVLLICAVYQNYSGQRDEALKTTQQMLSLAEHHGLTQEVVWANWGACAICVQKGDLKQAAVYLQRLQSRLRAQNEWILANFIEMVEQSLSQHSAAAKANGVVMSQNQKAIDPMHLIFDWLQHWGTSDLSPVPELQGNSHLLLRPDEHKTFSSQSLSSVQWLKKYWLTVKRVVMGDIKLQWVENGIHPQRGYDMHHQALSFTPSNSHQFNASPAISSQSLIYDHPWTKPNALSRLKVVSTGASLLVYCLGSFRVYQDERPIDDWPSSKGKAIFKYLVTHRERPVLKDILMDLFWPDTQAESARNNLNVAVYGLRQALRKNHSSYSHVLFINDCYLLNPETTIWLDCDAFLKIINAARKIERNGDLKTAIIELGKAETLYQGEFLAEDRYEDWLLPLRENLHMEYLSLLDRLNHHFFEKHDYQACIHMCRKMLNIDPCNEAAHRHLMRCFFEQGQSYLALRQYYLCVESLKEGLEVSPTYATTELYEYIRRHS